MQHRDCPLCKGLGQVRAQEDNVLPFPSRDIPPERMTDAQLWAQFAAMFPWMRGPGDTMEFSE